MAWTNIPAFTVGQVLTSSRMNEMRDNQNIGHLICTSTTRPSSPDVGTMIYETNTSKFYVWSGSAWVSPSSDAVVCDSSGRISLPYQPMFSGRATTGNTAGNVWKTYVDVAVNVGNHFNATTGLFTVPVAGNYFFIFSAFTEANQGAELYFYINGITGRRVYSANGTTTYVGINPGIAILTLSANDTVGVYVNSGQTHYNLNNLFVGWKVS